MKQKITLLIFMALASVFTFGQNTVQKQSEKHFKNEHLDKKNAERRTRVFDFKTKQKAVLKSTDAEKQRLDYSIETEWDSESSQWENSGKSEFTYDANGNPTVEIESYWNSESSQWENSGKYEYTYDANGNPTVEIESDWNSESSQWENNGKYEYTYDFSYSLNDLILPNIDYFMPNYSNLIVNKPVDFISYDYIDGSQVKYWKVTYYYSTVTVSSVSDLSKQDYSIYPNPNFGQFYVPSSENCNIRISNVMGQKIIEKQKIYKGVNNEINLSLFPKGVYIIEVMNSSNKLLESQKLIV